MSVKFVSTRCFPYIFLPFTWQLSCLSAFIKGNSLFFVCPIFIGLLAIFTCFSSTSPAFADNSNLILTDDPTKSSYLLACPSEGQGYFYLPGTNICFRISGYVRSDTKGGDNLYARKREDLHRKTYAWRSRAAFRVNTSTDTDLGTLRSFIELRVQWTAGSVYGDLIGEKERLRFGYIELGGLRLGIDDSIFVHWTNYFGNVIMDNVLTPMGEAHTNAVSYTYYTPEFKNGSRISAILGFEQGNSDGDTEGFRYQTGGIKHYKKLSQEISNYRPNILGGLKWEHRLASLAAVAAFDSYYSEWATKIRMDIQATDKLALWTMAGYKSMEDYYNIDDTYMRHKAQANGALSAKQGIYRQINSLYGDWGGHWIFWAGGTYTLKPETDLNMQLSYSSDKTFAATTNIRHMLVPGLALVPELSYASWDNNYGYQYGNSYEEKNSFKSKEAVQGMMRLQRSF